MPSRYRIQPGLGIARLGDSTASFCISPDVPAALPTDCDANGEALLSPDGTRELPVSNFKDAEGRIRRQAARFQVFVYDDAHPDGVALRIGDFVEGGGNRGTLIDIQWRVHLANKKASFYEFHALKGEHGYENDHPVRNADFEGEARTTLIIDPGPQMVDRTRRRRASFSRDGNPMHAATFPPEGLVPRGIDTLGELIVDREARLLVLGGHGNSGSVNAGLGQPRIDNYANTDGWFDDTSDGPVMARLVMMSSEVDQVRYVDVEAPAWVIAGYPRYAPEILDVVTLADLLDDLFVRMFGARTDMYGSARSFDAPETVDLSDAGALKHWRAGRLTWNDSWRPWFWRDIWPILFRADEMSYLSAILALSNMPHNQTERGTFDPYLLCVPPFVVTERLAEAEACAVAAHVDGGLIARAFEPLLTIHVAPSRHIRAALRAAAAAFASAICEPHEGESARAYLDRWRRRNESGRGHREPGYAKARAALDACAGDFQQAVQRLPRRHARHAAARPANKRGARHHHGEPAETDPAKAVERALDDFASGRLLSQALDRARSEATRDPWLANRRHLYDMLRRPGEENQFDLAGRPTRRISHVPLMPLLCGDNPMSNDTPSKFLRLTDTQLFMLRQWAEGKFVNEVSEGWVAEGEIDVTLPYAGWTARGMLDRDRGALANLLGGAFCPGGEVSWIIRNPAIWSGPFQLRADMRFAGFTQTAAQACREKGAEDEEFYDSYANTPLSWNNTPAGGLQPGDLTRMSGLPWQADFNECTTQTIDVTYEMWNSVADADASESRVWETMWWPSHRPLQAWEYIGAPNDPLLLNWSRGIPQTYAGDLKMVTAWSSLPFVVRNEKIGDDIDQPSPDAKYVAKERNGSAA